MNTFCFIDESWQTGPAESVGVLAAVVGTRESFEELNRRAFQIRRKYFGDEHARDLLRELKGKDLFSKAAFRHAKPYSKNLAVAREMLAAAEEFKLQVAAISVFGHAAPALLSPNPKQLSEPFRQLCIRLMACMPLGDAGQLIFDQRLGAQEGISISGYNYLAGIAPPQRLFPLPLVAVSNVSPGVQLADIVAHIIGRHGLGDTRFNHWYRLIHRLQIEGHDHRRMRVYGLMRCQWLGDEKYGPRKARIKKELGPSGKEGY